MTSTSPAPGADSAPGPPGYAPIPQSVPGPQSVTAQLMVVLDVTIVNVALPTWSSPRDHGHLT